MVSCIYFFFFKQKAAYEMRISDWSSDVCSSDLITEPYVTTRVRGTGLGLAIVKKIVEEHFGVLEFLDRPGNGTIARITFDMAMLAAEQERVNETDRKSVV